MYKRHPLSALGRLLLVGCCLTVAAACTTPAGRQRMAVLHRADSLLQRQPAAALAIADSLLADAPTYSHVLPSLFQGSGKGSVMRARLVRLAAYNKLDTVFTAAHVAEAKTLADWFDHHGTPNQQMTAHYLLGRTYADTGEAPQAIEAYNDAAAKADTTAKDCDYRTLSRIYAQMAQVYYCQLLPDNMVREERQAMKYAMIGKDTMQYLYCYGMLAEGYDMKNMNDSALQILSEAYSLYNKIGERQMASTLCGPMAAIHTQQNDYEQAEKKMREFETQSGFFDKDGDIEPGREMFYFNKGMFCLKTSEKGKAEYFFRKLLGVAGNNDLMIAALDGLQQFYAKYHDKDSLVKYTLLRDSICNIAHNEVEMQKTLQVQAMYDYTRSEQMAHKKEYEAERFKRTLIVVCGLSIILCLLFTIAYIRKQNINRLLEDRILLLRGYAVNKSLYDSPVAQRFRQLLKENPLNYPELSDWKELRMLIDSEVPSFQKTLSQGSRQLTDFETDVCMLIKIQVSSSDIARLKQCTPAYITQTRKGIYQKLFMKKGRANELDEYVMSLS